MNWLLGLTVSCWVALLNHKYVLVLAINSVIYGVSYLRNEAGKIVVDKNGMPQAGEEKVIGTVSPDFRIGFNTTFEFYKFRLSAVIDWKQEIKMYAGTAGMLDYYGVSKKSADFRKSDSFLF